MKQSETIYPDISDILKAKAERRRDIARRSFGEKIAMMEALRERVAPFKRAREQRRAAKRVHPSGLLPDTSRREAYSAKSPREAAQDACHCATSSGCHLTDHPVSAVYPIGQLHPTANSFIFVSSIRSAKASGLPRR